MTHTIAALRRHNNWLTWAMLALAIWIFAPPVLMRHLFIDLRSVEVSPDLTVTADRIIRRDFEGRFLATVRDEAGTIVCTAGSDGWIAYSTDANAANPVIRPLWWWLGSREALADCIDRGLAGGERYIVTCQWAKWRGIVFGPRCVDSDRFTVPDLEMNNANK